MFVSRSNGNLNLFFHHRHQFSEFLFRLSLFLSHPYRSHSHHESHLFLPFMFNCFSSPSYVLSHSLPSSKVFAGVYHRLYGIRRAEVPYSLSHDLTMNSVRNKLHKKKWEKITDFSAVSFVMLQQCSRTHVYDGWRVFNFQLYCMCNYM